MIHRPRMHTDDHIPNQLSCNPVYGMAVAALDPITSAGVPFMSSNTETREVGFRHLEPAF
jgi:hypothetical protein